MTTKGYKEKIQLMQQIIDKQEKEIQYLNNELFLCKETKKEKERKPQKKYPSNLTKRNTTTTPMVKFESPDVATILEGRINAMKMYTRKKR